MDQDHAGLLLLDDPLKALKHPGGDVGEGLAGLHNVQVIVRHNLKGIQHLVQHLPVLGSDAHQGFKLGAGLELFDQGGHFDGFGPGAEHQHDFDFFHDAHILFG